MKSSLDLLGNQDLRNKIEVLEGTSDEKELRRQPIESVLISLDKLMSELESLLVKV